VVKLDLDIAPCQCADSRVAPYKQLSGKISDIRCASSNLFYGINPRKFFLFPKFKTTLKERRFQSIEKIQENATRELRAIRGNAFQQQIQQWKKSWEPFIASGGDYFEGDRA
jgi:hypothetical protein